MVGYVTYRIYIKWLVVVGGDLQYLYQVVGGGWWWVDMPVILG